MFNETVFAHVSCLPVQAENTSGYSAGHSTRPTVSYGNKTNTKGGSFVWSKAREQVLSGATLVKYTVLHVQRLLK